MNGGVGRQVAKHCGQILHSKQRQATRYLRAENILHKEKDHCPAGLQFNQIGFNTFTLTNNNIFSSSVKLNMVILQTRYTVILPPMVIVPCSIHAMRGKQVERHLAMLALLPIRGTVGTTYDATTYKTLSCFSKRVYFTTNYLMNVYESGSKMQLHNYPSKLLLQKASML